MFVAPYDDPYTIAGQGTIGNEVLRQIKNLDKLDAIFVAVGALRAVLLLRRAVLRAQLAGVWVPLRARRRRRRPARVPTPLPPSVPHLYTRCASQAAAAWWRA